MNVPKGFASIMCCGSLVHSPAYLIKLLHTPDRLHHGIGCFPSVSDLKSILERLRSSKLITNDGAKALTHWSRTLKFLASEDL